MTNPKRQLSACRPEDCQAQYFLRGVIPHFPQILAGWQSDSRAARAQMGGVLDLACGTGALNRLDLFPAAQAGAPLLLFLHGGYWQGGDKSDVSFIASAFVKHGISVAIPNYSLAPHASIDTMLAEARDAFRWLAQHAQRYGIDRKRMVALGHSAGGQLAAMMLTDAWAPHDEQGSIVHAAGAISGLFDLRPLRHTGLNDALGLTPESAARLSPVDHLQTGGPLQAFVGELETPEFHVQAQLIEASWPRVLPTLTVPGAHHYSVLDAMLDPGSEMFKAIARMAGAA